MDDQIPPIAAADTDTVTNTSTAAGRDPATLDPSAVLQAAEQESPAMIPLRGELIASRDALQQAFLDLIDTDAKVKAARAAQEARVWALEEAEAQAYQAALRTFAEGTAKARHTERAADGRQQRLGRELNHGTIALAELAQQAALASDAVQQAGERARRAHEAVMAAPNTTRQQRRNARTQELLEQLAQLVSDGHADNAELTRLAQGSTCTASTILGSSQLYLPGESVARAAAAHAGEMGHLLAEQGFFVVFAPDLSSAEVPEDQGRCVAENKGVDLSALYQGWFL